jgi:hypothetical protein
MLKSNKKPFNTQAPGALPEFTNMVIGGQSGTGKTHLLGTVGKGERALVLDLEGGTVTYNSEDFKDSEDASDKIEVVTFDDLTKPQDLILRIEQVFDYVTRSKNSDKYAVIGVDGLTALQVLFLQNHTAPDPRQAYGDWGRSLVKLILKARAVPTHTVWTSQLKNDFDEVQGKEIVRLNVSPAAWGSVSMWFDALGFYGMNSQGRVPSRVLDFTPSNRNANKERYGIRSIKNPTLRQVFDKIASAT